MGTMMLYGCGKCGYSKQLWLGIGMMYPDASSEMKESIEAGKYGAELKSAYDSCKLPAVCPEDMVYLCPNCGCWDVFRDASIYEPVDVEAVRKKRGGMPYVMGYDIESGKYRVVSRYSPACQSCGEGMIPAPERADAEPDASVLKCPQCGSFDAAIEEVGYWD